MNTLIVSGNRNNTVVLGDINIDYLKWKDLQGNSKKQARLIWEGIQMLGFTKFFIIPTHNKGLTKALIDHCQANFPRRITRAGDKIMDDSDINIAVFNLRGKIHNYNKEYRKKII